MIPLRVLEETKHIILPAGTARENGDDAQSIQRPNAQFHRLFTCQAVQTEAGPEGSVPQRGQAGGAGREQSRRACPAGPGGVLSGWLFLGFLFPGRQGAISDGRRKGDQW